MKKFVALLITLLMVFSVLAGCGSKKAAATKNNNAPKVETKAEVKSNEQKSTPAAKVETGKTNATINGKAVFIDEKKQYNTKWEVANYIHLYKHLPSNYITKKQAEQLGWKQGSNSSLDKVAPGKSIGGDRFGNFERQLPAKSGRQYTECDIDYYKGNRGAKRIVYSNDGLIFYCGDHYKTFEKLF